MWPLAGSRVFVLCGAGRPHHKNDKIHFRSLVIAPKPEPRPSAPATSIGT